MKYRFGDFELDEEQRQLRRGGALVDLQPLVFNLISLLVRNRERVVSKDELLDTLWPDVTVTEASIQRAVSIARGSLGDDSHQLIRTFSGYGYRFCGVVQGDAGTSAAPPAETAPDPAAAPSIQYARAADGVSIGFWTLGEGSPLVYLPNVIWSHARLEWEFPEVRRWYARLAHNRMLVRLDLRGTGVSQREVEHYSYPAFQMDVLAVVDRVGLDRFALFGDLNAGQVAMRFAAEHPERVSRLVLWHGAVNWRGIENPKMVVVDVLQPLLEQDWETFTETRAHIGLGWLDGASAHRYAAFMRECASPEITLRSYAAARDDDVSALLPQIAAPTLVLHRRGFLFWNTQVSQRLAARIAGARLAVLEGAASTPFLGDTEAVLNAIDGFLSPG